MQSALFSCVVLNGRIGVHGNSDVDAGGEYIQRQTLQETFHRVGCVGETEVTNKIGYEITD